MKNIYKVFAAAALLSFAACTPKAEYVTYDFVNVPANALTNEAAVLEIPVKAVAQSGVGSEGTDVQFKVVEIVGTNGVDYTVEPANGIVSASMDIPGKIVVRPTNKVGEYTGDYKLAIEITGVSGDFTVGGSYRTTVTIQDIDHPLAEMLGTYKSTEIIVDAWGDKYEIVSEVSPVSGSVNQVTVSNLCPYSAKNGYTHKFKGIVDDDMTTITIPSNQWIVTNGLLFLTPDGSDLVLTFDKEKKTLTTSGPYGATSNGTSFNFDLIQYSFSLKKQ